ncbi:MAG: hypothetical protein IPN17_00525 [Deltaproteobacteria bacterium]|nr:hypothetical protein [Deltaproteobacteria bacterium]
MSSSEVFRLVFGVLAGLALIPLLISIGRLMTVEVDDEDAVLVTSFGRLVRTLREPGMQWMPARMLPGWRCARSPCAATSGSSTTCTSTTPAAPR